MKEYIYRGIDEEVQIMHKKAADFLFKFHKLEYEEKEKRIDVLKSGLKYIGENSYIQKPFYCDYGKNIKIGTNTFINANCVMLDMADITIGNYVLIAPNVTLTTATHSLDHEKRRNRQGYAKEIIIEDDVWIGANVTVLPGVILRRGTVVGAGSVVKNSTEEYDVVVGVPAEFIKKAR